MSIDKRFALIDTDGDYRYPYKKSERGTNRYGFVLGRDRHGEGEYTDDVKRVIRAVVFDGASARVKTEEKNPSKGGNSLSLHAEQNVVGYWISPELLPLVAGARFRPINEHTSAASETLPKLNETNEPFQAPLDILDSTSLLASLDELEPPLLEPQTPVSIDAPGAEIEVANDPQCVGVPETVRRALVDARIGQGSYRRKMLLLWSNSCAVSGASLQPVLVASHAKPWAESSNAERLDEYNGLLLAASLDRLFDRGLISFGSDGQILRKDSVTDAELARVGLTPCSALRKVHPRHLPYLSAHRQKHGFAS